MYRTQLPEHTSILRATTKNLPENHVLEPPLLGHPVYSHLYDVHILYCNGYRTHSAVNDVYGIIS